jgi:hypothetical protein
MREAIATSAQGVSGDYPGCGNKILRELAFGIFAAVAQPLDVRRKRRIIRSERVTPDGRGSEGPPIPWVRLLNQVE